MFLFFNLMNYVRYKLSPDVIIRLNYLWNKSSRRPIFDRVFLVLRVKIYAPAWFDDGDSDVNGI